MVPAGRSSSSDALLLAVDASCSSTLGAVGLMVHVCMLVLSECFRLHVQ